MHASVPLVASTHAKASCDEAGARSVPCVSTVGWSADRRMATPQPFAMDRNRHTAGQLHRNNEWERHRNHDWKMENQRGVGHTGAPQSNQGTERQRYCKSKGCYFFKPADERDITKRIEDRSSARSRRDYKEADSIKADLEARYGIEIDDYAMLWGVPGHFTPEEQARMRPRGGRPRGAPIERTSQGCSRSIPPKVEPRVHLPGQAHDSLPELSEEVSHNSSGDGSCPLRGEQHRNLHHYESPTQCERPAIRSSRFSDGRHNHGGRHSIPPGRGYHPWKR